MARRRIRIVPAAALEHGVEAIKQEAGVGAAFSAAAEAEAGPAAHRLPPAPDRAGLPVFTLHPPGSRDPDQALHVERRGDGHRVRYAIADVAAFVAPGRALDHDVHARDVTVYAPTGKAPLHPTALSEGAASLLPDQWTPAVLWTLDLDARG